MQGVTIQGSWVKSMGASMNNYLQLPVNLNYFKIKFSKNPNTETILLYSNQITFLQLCLSFSKSLSLSHCEDPFQWVFLLEVLGGLAESGKEDDFLAA